MLINLINLLKFLSNDATVRLGESMYHLLLHQNRIKDSLCLSQMTFYKQEKSLWGLSPFVD